MFLSGSQPYPLQKQLGPDRPFGLWHPGIGHGQLHILKGRCPGYQVKGLEYKPDFPVSDIGELVRPHVRHVNAVQVIVAQGGPVQAPKYIHQGGLSGTGVSHNGHKLSSFDGKVYLFKSQYLDGSGIIYLDQILQLNQGAVMDIFLHSAVPVQKLHPLIHTAPPATG